MNKSFVYDPKNKKMRTVVVRSCTFQLIAAFILAMLIALALSFFLFLLSLYLPNIIVIEGTRFPWALFLGFTLQIVLMMAIITPVLYLTQGKQEIKNNINNETITIDSQGTFGKLTINISNSDIKKVYVPIYAKSNLWKEYVGYYPVYCKVKKEIKNGKPQNYRKLVSRNIFLTQSLEEVNEIIDFLNTRGRLA